MRKFIDIINEAREWESVAGLRGDAKRCTCSNAQLSQVGCECDAQQNLPVRCKGEGCDEFLRTQEEIDSGHCARHRADESAKPQLRDYLVDIQESEKNEGGYRQNLGLRMNDELNYETIGKRKNGSFKSALRAYGLDNAQIKEILDKVDDDKEVTAHWRGHRWHFRPL